MKRYLIIILFSTIISCAGTTSFISNYDDFVASYGANHLKIPNEGGGYRILYRIAEFSPNSPPPVSYGDMRNMNAAVSQAIINANTTNPLYCDYYFNFDSSNILESATKIETSCGINEY